MSQFPKIKVDFVIEGKNLELQMNRNDYKNYIEAIKIGTIDIPNLPVASHE